MNAPLRLGVLFVAFASAAFAADPTMKVASSSSDLKLAIVDTSKATPARDALHQVFATGLGEAVTERLGSPMGVRVKCVSADHAAFNLEAGVYDAVLVLTNSMPRQLVTSTLTRLAATLAVGKAEKKLYLVFNPSDPKLSELLTAAYPAAVNSPKFVQAIESANGPMVVARGN